jgi:hypothetical protein
MEKMIFLPHPVNIKDLKFLFATRYVSKSKITVFLIKLSEKKKMF